MLPCVPLHMNCHVFSAHLILSCLHRPIASFMFLGPTGVGKTQLAKALTAKLFDTEVCIYYIHTCETQLAKALTAKLFDMEVYLHKADCLLSWPQNSRGEGKIPFIHVCATRKTQFSNGSKRGFSFGRDLRRPT
jgi:hypothetical protein